MPQMGYGGMGGYGGFGGGFGMPQMGYGGMGGYGGFGGGFGMPQMGYGGFGGMGGYGGGFGMPQMGFGLGSFGSQMGFGGYGNYGGFQPEASYGGQFNPRMSPMGPHGDYDLHGRRMGDGLQAAQPMPPPGMKLNPTYDAGYAMAEDMPFPGSEQWLRKQQFIPANPPANNPPPGMIKNPYYYDRFANGQMGTMDLKFSDNEYINPAHLSLYEKQQEEERARYATPNPSTGVMPSEPIPDPSGAYIPDETGQYDPNRGNYGQVLQPTYSEPAPQIGSPIQPNQPRRMRNSMNMGIGSFFGGIGPGNFGNFY
jgi:hypothetical protein